MSRKRRNSREKKSKGRGSKAKPRRLASTDLVPALVDARIDSVRLVRALGAAGVDAGKHPGLSDALATCAALGDLLTRLIALYDRKPLGEDDAVPEESQQLLTEHADTVVQVLDVLPQSIRQRVRRERGRVAVVEAEIWREVEGLRQAAGGTRTTEPFDEEIRCLLEEIADNLECGGSETPVEQRVARHEARELPDACEVWAWLESLPVTWLRTIARLHGLDPEGTRARLATRIEEALLDPERLAKVLAEGLGPRERAELAGIVAAEGIPLADLTEDSRRGLEVPWNWSRNQPRGVGGRLRALGLVYVGMEEGECLVSVPLDLHAPIIGALRMADPKAWRNMDPNAKSYLTYLETGEITDGGDEDDEYVYGWSDEEGEEDCDDEFPLVREDLADGPPGNPDLRRWQERAQDVLDVLAGRFEDEPPPQDVIDRLFAPLSAVRPPRQKDVGYLMHLILFDWQSEVGDRTPAESLLARPGRLGKKRCAILESRCKERTALYRIESVLDGEGVEVVDAFTGGPKRKVDAPELAMAFEVGDLIPARLFQAGPYCLFDRIAEPVDASRADGALAWLEARFREFAMLSCTVDREAFLRTYPECVTLASLRTVDVEEGECKEQVDLHLREPQPPPSRRSARRQKPEKVYVLDIDLVDSEPRVTRRLQVSGRVTLDQLHDLLQDVMGWDDAHMHVFEARDGSWRYADPHGDMERIGDETTVTLDEVATRKGSRFFYQYDFGDCWLLEIRVAERLDPKKAGPEPWCLGGQNACPPEDSGGVWGYAFKLEVLANSDHPDHDDVLEWMGDDFDPTHFDPEEINQVFRSGRDP